MKEGDQWLSILPILRYLQQFMAIVLWRLCTAIFPSTSTNLWALFRYSSGTVPMRCHLDLDNLLQFSKFARTDFCSVLKYTNSAGPEKYPGCITHSLLENWALYNVGWTVMHQQRHPYKSIAVYYSTSWVPLCLAKINKVKQVVPFSVSGWGGEKMTV